MTTRLPCSCFNPSSFILFAACSAFFLSRQIFDASWFFRWFVELRLEEPPGDSTLTDLNSVSWHQIRLPIESSFCGSGRGSLPSPCRALPPCDSRYGISTRNTGSVKSGTIWESSIVTELQSRWALGPLDWALYCQKYGFAREPADKNFWANLIKSSVLSPAINRTQDNHYEYKQLDNQNKSGTIHIMWSQDNHYEYKQLRQPKQNWNVSREVGITITNRNS